MANNQNLIVGLVLALGLSSCSQERHNTAPDQAAQSSASTATNAFVSTAPSPLTIDTNAWKEMIGKRVRLAGVLLEPGKGNHDLQTTNGFVRLGSHLEVAESEHPANVILEGRLRFEEAVKIPETFDPNLVQWRYGPGQTIPAHYVLEQWRIVSPTHATP